MCTLATHSAPLRSHSELIVLINVGLLWHARLLEPLLKLWIKRLIPKTCPALSLTLLDLRVRLFVIFEESSDFRFVMLSHGVINQFRL